MLKKSSLSFQMLITILIVSICFFLIVSNSTSFLNFLKENSFCDDFIKKSQNYNELIDFIENKCFSNNLNLDEDKKFLISQEVNSCYNKYKNIKTFNNDLCILCSNIKTEKKYEYDNFIEDLNVFKKNLLKESTQNTNINNEIFENEIFFNEEIKIYFKVLKIDGFFYERVDFNNKGCKNVLVPDFKE